MHFKLKLTWHLLNSNVRHTCKMTTQAGSLSSLKTAEKKIAIDFLAVGSLSNCLTPILLTPGLIQLFRYWVSTHMEKS